MKYKLGNIHNRQHVSLSVTAKDAASACKTARKESRLSRKSIRAYAVVTVGNTHTVDIILHCKKGR